ncbi:transposase [Aquibaculum sediminis]|uniref:transposase n=1 Tax=Aquibaculum sediminis TaxID=3231907 RepID=UPI0034522E02
MGHLLMENRSALIVDALLTRASGTAEREAALTMIDRTRKGRQRITLGVDKAYDVRAFVTDLHARNVTPHVAIDGNVRVSGRPRATAIDRRITRHLGYAVSQRLRKRIEEGFGWIKTTRNLAKTRHRGLDRVGWSFTLTAAAYNLVRLPKLLATG